MLQKKKTYLGRFHPNNLRKIGFLFLSFVSFPFSSVQSKNYFQQEVNYTLDVKLNDIKNELLGFAKIEYLNNSPDSLREIYFHIWPNAYKNESTAMAKQLLEDGETEFYYSKQEERGLIESLQFKVNEIAATFRVDEVHIDIGKLILNTVLAPGEKINITTPFYVKLPSAKFSRLGNLNQSYMLTQWYPKPAVYDARGWHAMPYLNTGEFYSEFGNFEVSITLPKNYVVGATGYLQDSSELAWLSQKAIETEAIMRFQNANLSFPDSDTSLKTLHYKASAVHDFALFADKRFHVLKNEIELPISKRKISTWTYFTNAQPSYWKQGPELIKETILYYSNLLGEYPYDQVSIVDGTIAAGGGMEYPMITVIGNALSFFDFEYTVLHELGHNWFYGILASNERDYAWMDEGLNTYYNLRYMESKYPQTSFLDGYIDDWYLRFAHLKKYTHKAQYVLGYLGNARKNLDQGCHTTSSAFTYSNYGNEVYSKTGFSFHYLAKFLGESTFDSIMKTYYETWKFKHPQPKDLRSIFEQGDTLKLNWFFDDLLGSTKKLDYHVSRLKKKDNTLHLQIKNKGNISGPLSISSISNKKVTHTLWVDGFEGSKYFTFPRGDIQSFEIDHAWDMPEIKRTNNVIRSSGIFKKIEPIQLQLIGSVENSEKTTLNFFPIIGYNSYDKVMSGIAFYSSPFLEKNWEYLLMPLFAFGSKEVNGSAQLGYNFHPKYTLQTIRPEVELKKYSFRDNPFALGYIKIAPSLEFTLRKKYARSSILQKIKIRFVGIAEDEANYNGLKKEYQNQNYSQQYYLTGIHYSLKNERKINPFEFLIQLEQGKNYIKTALEASYHISYERRNKSADFRFFGGKMLFEKNTSPYFGFAMSGNNDYAYDNIYIGRNDPSGVFNQQFYTKDGGFKNQTLTPNSLNWMLAMNLLLPAPGKIPFAFYADFGKATSSETLDYDCGIALVVLKNYLEIYAPIKQSSDLNQLNYAEKIRFVLHLNSMNPLLQLKNLLN